jgi:Na+/melibiose symporter-like transporter
MKKSASVTLDKKAPILSVQKAVIYGVGIMGVQFCIGLVNSYQAEFFNKNFGANLMIVAVIILCSKIISIVADFIIGNLIDRSHLKGGKMRPWIFISAFPIVALTMLMFVVIPFKSDIAKYFYIAFISILWNVSMSLADIPSQGMLALLSPNAEERNMAAGIANTLKSVALGSPGIIVTVVCMLTGSAEVGKKEYLITAGVICVLGLVLFLLIYFCNKENLKSNSSGAMSFKDMFHELKNNKMLLILFLTFMLGFGRNIGLGIAVQASSILLREGVAFSVGSFVFEATGDKISWLIGLTAGVSSMISIITVPMVNKKWGEKKTFIVYAVYGFIVSVAAFALYATGIAPLRTLWAILIYQFFIGFMYGPHGYLPMVMTSDIVDYREWQTGKRTEGTQFAVLSLSNKLSNAISVAVGIFLVGAIGYSSETYFFMMSSGAEISSYITDGMQTALFAVYILIPGVCALLSMLPMFRYKIDGDLKKQMREDLAEKRAKTNSEI